MHFAFFAPEGTKNLENEMFFFKNPFPTSFLYVSSTRVPQVVSCVRCPSSKFLRFSNHEFSKITIDSHCNSIYSIHREVVQG